MSIRDISKVTPHHASAGLKILSYQPSQAFFGMTPTVVYVAYARCRTGQLGCICHDDNQDLMSLAINGTLPSYTIDSYTTPTTELYFVAIADYVL